MKIIISILFIAAVLSSCSSNSQTRVHKKAAEIKEAIKPGATATTASGFTMNAKINGSYWVASSMVPPDAAGRIVGYYKKQYIGLPYNKTSIATGKKIILNEDEAADIFLDDGCLYPLTKGEIEIIKVDGSWAEGKFFFTTSCSSINKVVKIKDGFFRIPFTKN
jgi:hypothetical protein